VAVVGIIGAGAWGTALAQVARRAGQEVVLWARDPALASAINATHENARRLPGVRLDPRIRATAVLADAANAEILLLAVPAQHLRELCRRLTPKRGGTAVICAKGIERASGALMSEVVAADLPGREPAVLSGPTFAEEVARGLPTAVTIACADPARAAAVAQALGDASFRPYVSRDVVGAQVAGAVKNVLAIACGIAEGRGLGSNARAALITRGLAELARFAVAMGGEAESLMGLAGVGDLVLTCTSRQSRNFSLGVALGGGQSLDEILRSRSSVAEGVETAAAVAALADRCGVEMPICRAVDAVLHRGAGLAATIDSLLSRPLRRDPELRSGGPPDAPLS
jgi:glycerol-3-phosphate dehydrogenase (NAD(P)+)